MNKGSGKAENCGDECPFCSASVVGKALIRLGTVYAISDTQPVTDGHLLVVPFRHTVDFFSMTDEEHRDADELLHKLRQRALEEDPAITGFNVGSNCGVSAGQKVMHAHIHFIPRRPTDAPAGRGVKGVIRNKITY